VTPSSRASDSTDSSATPRLAMTASADFSQSLLEDSSVDRSSRARAERNARGSRYVFVSLRFVGRHGFDLRPVGARTEITHTLEMDRKGKARVLWPALMNPIHDWCVEAIFDRLEEALRTGKIPAISDRRMPLRSDASLKTLRALVNVRASRRIERRTTRQSLDA
jgi:hypothetical protein